MNSNRGLELICATNISIDIPLIATRINNRSMRMRAAFDMPPIYTSPMENQYASLLQERPPGRDRTNYTRAQEPRSYKDPKRFQSNCL